MTATTAAQTIAGANGYLARMVGSALGIEP